MGLTHKGVNYDVGLNFTPGSLSRAVWNTALMEHEISVIRHQLHCNAVNIYGSDADRLLASAAFALEQGLHVWLQPRLVDGTIDATIALVLEVAQGAEVLRQRFGHLALILGGEFSLTSAGIVPGATLDERVTHLTSSFTDMEGLNHNLNAMLQRALVATRSVFNGAVTYASGSWEAVDWHHFDIVAVNLYRDAANHASYRDELRQRQQWGKPLAITEFGCCAYQGADQVGAMGFDVVDWEAPVPLLNQALVRDEQVQADYLAELIQLYQAEGVFGAFVFTFIEPTNPHSADPRFDLDLASFSLVKVYPPGTGHPPSYWEPKLAFAAVASLYQAI